MTTPDNTGEGADKAMPSNIKTILSAMEGDLLTIKDLGNAVCAICESSQGIEQHIAGALNRIGYLIAERAEEVELNRYMARRMELEK